MKKITKGGEITLTLLQSPLAKHSYLLFSFCRFMPAYFTYTYICILGFCGWGCDGTHYADMRLASNPEILLPLPPEPGLNESATTPRPYLHIVIHAYFIYVNSTHDKYVSFTKILVLTPSKFHKCSQRA